ncbi:MAG: hypothetical protein Q8J99_16320 [Sulfuritalea sp.]|nr:hypothetical protein [Sulfuritalea sp.]
MNRLVFALLLSCSLAWGQGLEIIDLRHRSAEQLLPQLAPFVEPGGALSGINDRLFLRASARNQAEIRDLVAALDTPLRRLMISVRQEGADTGAQSGGGVSARIEVGAGTPVISGRGHLTRSDSRSRRDISQQVQTIDGGRAAIMVGQSMVVPLRQVVLTPAGVVVAESLVQRDLGTGFVAVPRLSGERVTIEISPRDDTAGPLPGSVNTQRLLTTVSGRLGEWLELGGSMSEQSGSAAGISGYGAGAASRQRRLLLKVEELP